MRRIDAIAKMTPLSAVMADADLVELRPQDGAVDWLGRPQRPVTVMVRFPDGTPMKLPRQFKKWLDEGGWTVSAPIPRECWK